MIKDDILLIYSALQELGNAPASAGQKYTAKAWIRTPFGDGWINNSLEGDSCERS